MEKYVIFLTVCVLLLICIIIYVFKNRKRIALDSIIKKSEKGDIKAMVTLGFMFYMGEGVEKDIGRAEKLIRKAADNGSGEAQYILGGMYLSDSLGPKDEHEAFKWILKSGESGFRPAEVSLGHIYAEGRMAQRDSAESVRWFKRAAEKGDTESQKIIAGVYQFTVGMDRKTAYAWYTVAASNGDAYSGEMAENLLKEFNESEQSEAKEIAMLYLKSYKSNRKVQ